MSLNNLGFVAYDAGEYETAAVAVYRSTCYGSDSRKQNNDLIHHRRFLRRLALQRDDPGTAAALAGAAEELRLTMGSEIEPAERQFRDTYLAKLRTIITEPDFHISYEKGRRLRMEQIVAICLENVQAAQASDSEGEERLKAIIDQSS